MSIFAETLDRFDKAMGIESAACAPDNPQALALVNAGISLLDTDVEITGETRLNDIAPAPELLQVLKNLDAVFLQRVDLTLGNAIIKNVTITELITYLDATKVNTLIDSMIEGEKREASNMVQVELSDLDNQIRA
jgi:hypothetical protein